MASMNDEDNIGGSIGNSSWENIPTESEDGSRVDSNRSFEGHSSTIEMVADFHVVDEKEVAMLRQENEVNSCIKLTEEETPVWKEAHAGDRSPDPSVAANVHHDDHTDSRSQGSPVAAATREDPIGAQSPNPSVAASVHYDDHTDSRSEDSAVAAATREDPIDDQSPNPSVAANVHHDDHTDSRSEGSAVAAAAHHEGYKGDKSPDASVTVETDEDRTNAAIHALSAEDEKERAEIEARNAENDRLTEEFFQLLLESGEAMRCPECSAFIQKANENSDWLRCTICRTELCWATKGRRWGLAGKGDTSGGCNCRIHEGKPCAPDCKNCH